LPAHPDVAQAALFGLVADGHHLPFCEESMDAVVIQAVLSEVVPVV
jgi:hypothetical protein